MTGLPRGLAAAPAPSQLPSALKLPYGAPPGGAATPRTRAARGVAPVPAPRRHPRVRTAPLPPAGTAGRGDTSLRGAGAELVRTRVAAGNMWRPVSPRRSRPCAPSHGRCQRPVRGRPGSETRVLAPPESPGPGPCRGPSLPGRLLAGGTLRAVAGGVLPALRHPCPSRSLGNRRPCRAGAGRRFGARQRARLSAVPRRPLRRSRFAAPGALPLLLSWAPFPRETPVPEATATRLSRRPGLVGTPLTPSPAPLSASDPCQDPHRSPAPSLTWSPENPFPLGSPQRIILSGHLRPAAAETRGLLGGDGEGWPLLGSFSHRQNFLDFRLALALRLPHPCCF